MPNLPIDWQVVRMRYEAGQSAYKISQDLGGRPTKQGISKRANKEGWVKGNGSAITVASQLPIVKQAIALAGTTGAPSKCTPERVGFILDLVSRGASEKLAASAAGVCQDTLTNWKRKDRQLEEQLRQARAGKLAEWISRIDDASQRDWKAADRLLQASPEAEEYNHQQTGGITIVLNIDRAETKPIGEIIEG